MTACRCGGHTGLSAELRVAALEALDRWEPVLGRLRSAPEPAAGPGAAGTPSPSGDRGTCAACPVCALIALVRGERPEMALRLADHAAGLIALARATLAADATAPDPFPDPPQRPVQHIPVTRP